jgi:two-component system CheB/CheR fusion protein
MPSRKLPDHAWNYPIMRQRFESSRLLVARARERAVRAAERAEAMRVLLESNRALPPRRRTPEAGIWEAAAHQLIRASRARDESFGVLSHELRQSLAAAIAAERLLAASADPTTVFRARDVLERQLLHLMKLVDGMLDLSRLSLRHVNLTKHGLDLRTVVRLAVETIAPSAASARQQLNVTLCSTPQPVDGDETRLLQVFTNLLQNAVRYTAAEGRIDVTSATVGTRARVTVADTGEGLSAEMQQVIFDPFVRGSAAGDGLGIGLALARRIVELHNGDIAVASDGPGCGTRFTVTLPLSDARAHQ